VSDTDSLAFLQCLTTVACPGNSVCGKGYIGRACGQCQNFPPKYYLLGHQCKGKTIRCYIVNALSLSKQCIFLHGYFCDSGYCILNLDDIICSLLLGTCRHIGSCGWNDVQVLLLWRYFQYDSNNRFVLQL
jgi:hypothetical protein